MGNNNKSYRIRTTVGREADSFIDVHLDQDYDSLEILSLKISDKDVYKLHNSDYGVVVGRVLANGNFGVPNAKISVFIAADEQNEDMKMWNLYPYTSTTTKNDKDIRYNLLPDESVKDCHKAVGTFPNKTYLLENDSLLEVFDKYYIYTTRTNAAGDYLICGVPTGMQTLHMDLDLSDCGILSQRPRDFVYKGYTIEQFENPNQFKKDENIDGLSQIFSQNQPVYVKPFWGNEDNGDEIGITRADISISFKFEPTCVFMGSAISDNASNGVGKKCVPTNQMGAMDELTAGEGTIEMIRKTPAGNVEEFAIKGNQVINGNGVWCYQIPMNLDYMMTDEYGNMVPTDDPEKGIPTRTRVRFRASLTDMENSSQSFYRAKYLIPNNPDIDSDKVDYDFGTYTDEDSYRDLFWNGVYTVKSYIPRFQKSKRWRNERFSGIKACNYYGGNNPMPYNNLRIKLPFMFTVLCIFVKLFIKLVTLINRIITGIIRIFLGLVDALANVIFAPIMALASLIPGGRKKVRNARDKMSSSIINKFLRNYAIHCTFIGDGLCPDMEGWYFAPGCASGIKNSYVENALMVNTLAAAIGNGDSVDMDNPAKEAIKSTDFIDETATDVHNTSTMEEQTACVTRDVDYLLNCFEMNLAEEYRVIKFDFYNDWVNGVIYFPRWMRKIKRKKKYKLSIRNGITTYYKDKVKGCMNSENSTVKKSRYYTQQCSLKYEAKPNRPWTGITTEPACNGTKKENQNKKSKVKIFPARCHKKKGMAQSSIFGPKAGLVREETTMLGQYVYYLKPCEWKDTINGKKRTLLFATDIVLLGTLNDCDENGIPQAFKYLNNSSYIMPTNLALTTMDDDAYIYVSKNGTVCNSSKTKSTIKNASQDGALRVTPDYQSTYSGYSNTEEDRIEYSEYDDPIPITEAAGINWNYSGPGQDDVLLGKKESARGFLSRLFGGGNKRYEYLYYPGGHFLGLSCTNSETNIKSCVNLKRICEVGATMSQRREELRGYDSNDNPKFRYYVPTGLISNVDIEGASFRSMFATLNHKKLVATLTDEKTGYKKYDFRFLRPDGFDGSLGSYVHRAGSPYNRNINQETRGAVSDATSFFEEIFHDSWFRSPDYDPEETKYTETRTAEYSVDDYYMFRFGLNTFADKEQKKHYLLKEGGSYSMPQYENSFYFYFGLKDGSTALDEFKKQFFSECEANNIAKTPALSIKESINEDLTGSAKLIIDNMLPTYVITVKDNTLNVESSPKYSDSSSYDLSNFQEISLVIGHEYTVTVTDSIDRTLTKTFTFGASAVKVDIEAVHFRVPGIAKTRDPKKGGYIKINNNFTVLKNQYHIETSEKFRFVISGDTINEPINPEALFPFKYTDGADDIWYLAYLPKVGTYNVCLTFNDGERTNQVAIFTVVIEDNTKVNLYVACDYFGYKLSANEGVSAVLSGLTESDWKNGTPFRGATWKNWLMRHTFYRQTPDDTAGFDSYLYTKGKADIAVFGWPEKNGLNTTGDTGTVITRAYYANDFAQYQGYTVDDKYSFIPTMYWPNPTDTNTRAPFDAMSYTEDGRAAADALPVKITSYSYDSASTKVTLGYQGNILAGHGCIVVFENGVILFPVVISNQVMEAYYSYDIYPDKTNGEQGWTQELLSMATVYPTMMVPVIYKPFCGNVKAAVWNIQTLAFEEGENGETKTEVIELPVSYKIEGAIYNGLTFSDKFYPGDINEETGRIEQYQTYIFDNTDPSFWDGLTMPNLTRDEDWKPMRELTFGGNLDSAFYREITDLNTDVEDFDEIIYSVKEATPTIPGNVSGAVFTERYSDGFDQITLEDSCSFAEAFYDDLKIKVYNAQIETSGPCTLYTPGKILPTTKLYATNEEFFITNRPLFAFDLEDWIIGLHGYYNFNAKYDKNGEDVSIIGSLISPIFEYEITQENGTKMTKNVILSDEESIQRLKADGVNLARQYVLKDTYNFREKLLENIERVVSSTQPFDPANDVNPNIIWPNGTDAKTIIAVYEKPNDGSKNSMKIYKLYPFGAFKIMYPAEAGGIEPFLNPGEGGTYSCEAQTATIGVTTNINFIVTSSSPDWAEVNGSNFGPTTSNINISIRANTGDSSTDRTATIKFTPNENGLTDEQITRLTKTVSITQLKDSITPLNERVDGVEGEISGIQGQIETMEGQIADLTPPDNGE